MEKIYLAIVWATKKLHHYFLSYIVYYLANMDPIKYLFDKTTTLSRILARWQVIIYQYDLIYKTLKMLRGEVLADHVAKLPLDDYKTIYSDFPDEDILAIEV